VLATANLYFGTFYYTGSTPTSMFYAPVSYNPASMTFSTTFNGLGLTYNQY